MVYLLQNTIIILKYYFFRGQEEKPANFFVVLFMENIYKTGNPVTKVLRRVNAKSAFEVLVTFSLESGLCSVSTTENSCCHRAQIRSSSSPPSPR
jgi:hypothetical protein